MAQSDQITGIIPAGIPKPIMPFSPAVRAGDWLFVAGQMATDFVNGLPPEIAKANPNVVDTLAAEAAHLVGTLGATVEAGGASIASDAVRVWQWFTSTHPTLQESNSGQNGTGRNVRSYHDTVSSVFGDPGPASTDMGIRELMILNTSIEVDMICRVDGGVNVPLPIPAELEPSLSDRSPGIRRGDYIYISGQTGVAPDQSPLTSRGVTTFERQLENTLHKLASIAQASGSRLERAIKAEVYIGQPSSMAILDRVWRRWFPRNPPARLVVPYMGLSTKDSQVEIALTLLADDSATNAVTIETSEAPEPLGHEPQALLVDDLLYYSTQMAFDSDGLLAAAARPHPSFPYYTEVPQLQMAYILDNVAAIAEAAGSELENIVRRACFHDDFTDFMPSWQEWVSRFPGVPPASTTVNLARGPLVVPGARFLMDLIAYVPGKD